jgi:hypothetical protein
MLKRIAIECAIFAGACVLGMPLWVFVASARDGRSDEYYVMHGTFPPPDWTASSLAMPAVIISPYIVLMLGRLFVRIARGQRSKKGAGLAAHAS